jgi:superfamily II DNA or RNA helicase
MTLPTLRPYQGPATEWLYKRRAGLVIAPAGSGKTLIAAGAIHRVVTARVRYEKPRIGWIANTLEQIEQAYVAIGAFNLRDQIDFKAACVQGEPDMSDRHCLIVDECHHSLSPLWRSVIATAPVTCCLWGFTATPPEEKELEECLILMFGGSSYRIKRSEMGGNLAHAASGCWTTPIRVSRSQSATPSRRNRRPW